MEPPANALVLAGPERRTRETAEVLGLDAAPLSRLRDLGAGAWHGASFDDLPPEEVRRWLTEPGYRGHGGESILELRERVGGWLDDLTRDPATATVAVTHPAVVRAVLILVLDAAPESFWRIDVAPGSRVRLHHRGAWTLRVP